MNKNIQLLRALKSGMLMFLMSALLFFSSCKKSSHKKPIDAGNPLFLVQAKMVDLPVPIGYSLVENKSGLAEEKNKIVFHYRGNLGIEKITTFYQNEMEVNGWNIKDFSTKREGLLFCSKANKSCALSIRPNTVRIVLNNLPDNLPNHQRFKTVKTTSKSTTLPSTATPFDLINNKKIV